MKTLLHIRGLGLSRDGTAVCPPTSLDLSAGLYHLVGPNGCGKSTLLQLLAGVFAPDAGDAELGGASLRHAAEVYKSRMVWLSDRPNLYPFITGREWLRLMLSGRSAAAAEAVPALAAALAVDTLLDQRFDGLSLGQQRKLMLAACFAAAPALLLLDEPTNGLDGEAQTVLARWIASHSCGSVVLLACHEASWLDGMRPRRLSKTDGGWIETDNEDEGSAR